jgi:DivIVA domain-containing protein
MEPTNRTTTTARPRPGSIPTQGGSGAGQTTGRAGAFEEDADRRRFVTVLRGYDRIEVDEYIDDLLAVLATLRTSAADADKSRRTAEERAAAAERRAAESAKAQQPAAAPTEGFGVRAERLLRLAENEAAEIRAAAAAESSSIVERARADAEQRRHEAEQALITRSAQADQENARRTAALDEREGSLKSQIEAARGEIEMLTRAAQREADRLREQVRHEIDEKRAAAELAATRTVESVEKDVARLKALRESTRQELARIVEIVRTASAGMGQGTAPGNAEGSADRSADRGDGDGDGGDTADRVAGKGAERA